MEVLTGFIPARDHISVTHVFLCSEICSEGLLSASPEAGLGCGLDQAAWAQPDGHPAGRTHLEPTASVAESKRSANLWLRPVTAPGGLLVGGAPFPHSLIHLTNTEPDPS